jgi:hypothetical protein
MKASGVALWSDSICRMQLVVTLHPSTGGDLEEMRVSRNAYVLSIAINAHV